ncbi:cell division protein ZapC [Ferrimonas balearica]|uniref:cell division protein ZapC n=1 Tax=Ferrimonas balearica TaxID=44012 RepID=UPI001C9A0445|nr:cell division protein ZapC [Ferrimonas balearica]MBY5920442.1 cell division protein ZapC [Ferrimonas balearica]MBY5996873.1 cell division protein ZapC [Ferrimonas balearica]
MYITPEPSWVWMYHHEEEKLALEFGEDWLFLTPFNARSLIPDSLHGSAFSAEHADYYESVLTQLRKYLDLSAPELVQIALNLTAAHFFSLPMMPKSWHFKASEQIAYACNGKLVELNTGSERGRFVVVDGGEQSSLLMLLEDTLSLGNKKSLKRFELIKVMNDRLSPSRRLKHRRIVAA